MMAKEVEVLFYDDCLKDGKPSLWRMPNGKIACHTSLRESLEAFIKDRRSK